MKNFLKICLVAVVLLSANFVQAQTYKFAHIDTQTLIPTMPEYVKAQKEVETQAKGFDEQMKIMQTELQTKMTEYQQSAETMTDIVRQAKEEDLMNLQQRIQSFNQSAQQKLQQKQAELIQPIIDKVSKSIEKVAKEQKVIYVFDASQSTTPLLYKSSESIDLLPFVKKDLGV